MNILFFKEVIHPEKGGIGKVTCSLANGFRAKGHNVYFLIARDLGYKLENCTQIPSGNFSDTPANKDFLLEFLRSKKIDILINQDALYTEHSKLVFHAKSIETLKLISCLHMSLFGAIKNLRYTKGASLLTRFKLSFFAPLISSLFDFKLLKNFLLYIYKNKSKKHFTNLVKNSDALIVLSEKLKYEIIDIVKMNPANLFAIPNPISFEVQNVDLNLKEKKLLWVGRADSGKRLDLFIKIFGKIHQDFPDWTVDILGDGSGIIPAKEYVKKHNIKNVFFRGYMESSKFFERASIFCFTSADEAFGMVLLEASVFACVPIAFDSYPVITDIIDDKNNGILVKAFDCNLYAKELSHLMKDENYRKNIALNARNSVSYFSLDNITKRWLDLFESL